MFLSHSDCSHFLKFSLNPISHCTNPIIPAAVLLKSCSIPISYWVFLPMNHLSQCMGSHFPSQKYRHSQFGNSYLLRTLILYLVKRYFIELNTNKKSWWDFNSSWSWPPPHTVTHNFWRGCNVNKSWWHFLFVEPANPANIHETLVLLSGLTKLYCQLRLTINAPMHVNMCTFGHDPLNYTPTYKQQKQLSYRRMDEKALL